MTDVLGPCPVCGNTDKKKPVMDNGDSDHWHSARAVSTLGGDVMQCVCGFACTEDHWSLLRRKMTREEAETLLAPFHGSPDMGATDEQPTTAQWAALKSALTGEKT